MIKTRRMNLLQGYKEVKCNATIAAPKCYGAASQKVRSYRPGRTDERLAKLHRTGAVHFLSKCYKVHDEFTVGQPLQRFHNVSERVSDHEPQIQFFRMKRCSADCMGRGWLLHLSALEWRLKRVPVQYSIGMRMKQYR